MTTDYAGTFEEIIGETEAERCKRLRALIKLDPDRLVDVVTAIEQAMMNVELPIFEHSEGRLVYPVIEKTPGIDKTTTSTAALCEIKAPLMRQFMATAAMFKQFRRDKWQAVEPPEALAKLILCRRGFWPFPRIRGVLTVPTLRPDGSLLSAPGYDPATGLFLLDPLALPAMPSHPSKDDAARALQLLLDLLVEFPFVDEPSRSVALSGLITPIVRGMFDTVPLHALDAPEAGTGKSFLVDCISYMLSGYACPASTLSRNEEENEKRFSGSLMAAYPLMSIDNIDIALASPFVAQMVERPLVELRLLGSSNKPRVPSTTTVFATGNNLTIIGDLVRRTIRATLDAKMETPWTRQFNGNPQQAILADRGRYVAAALTIVRAYILAGRPEQLRPAFASFERWSNTVRSALVWLGQADPINTVAVSLKDDPKRQAASTLLQTWVNVIGLKVEITARGLISRAKARAEGSLLDKKKNPDLRDALFDVAAEKGNISPERLGRWLRDNKGKIIEGLRLDRCGVTDKRIRWAVYKIGGGNDPIDGPPAENSGSAPTAAGEPGARSGRLAAHELGTR